MNKIFTKIITIAILLFVSLLSDSCKKDDDNNPITVTDIDGNVYHTVTIGTQVWMVENLKTTHYKNGTAIPNVTDNGAWAALATGAYCDYGNMPSNSTTYGRLYNWYAVNTSMSLLCPAGWHVPSDAEWTTLINYLGGEAIAGGILKEIGLTHWISPNTSATNETGFTALPGGSRDYDGTFGQLGSYAHWWSYTVSDISKAWNRYLIYNNSAAYRVDYYKHSGFSVRCIKD